MTNATKHFLTIDNGGTNTKVIIVDQDGRQLSVSSFPTDAIERRPGFREVNPGQMWRDIGKAVKAALESAGLDGSQIDGVVPVGHGKGLYVLGKDGKPFMDGISPPTAAPRTWPTNSRAASPKSTRSVTSTSWSCSSRYCCAG